MSKHLIHLAAAVLALALSPEPSLRFRSGRKPHPAGPHVEDLNLITFSTDVNSLACPWSFKTEKTNTSTDSRKRFLLRQRRSRTF
jgi:hypothetical protein